MMFLLGNLFLFLSKKDKTIYRRLIIFVIQLNRAMNVFLFVYLGAESKNEIF